jgi:hypothetical protein
MSDLKELWKRLVRDKRKAHEDEDEFQRVLLRLVGEPSEDEVHVKVTEREGEDVFRVPRSMVPRELWDHLDSGVLLFANSNIGEADPSCVVFEAIELAGRRRATTTRQEVVDL